MKERARFAIAVGCLGGWIGCIAAGLALKAFGHREACAVMGLASLPWLFGALWFDRRPR